MLAAILQDHAELVAGGAADDVAAAQGAGQPLAHAHDHFVAGIEAETVIDHGQAVDRGHQEGAVAAFLLGALDGLGQSLAQGVAVQMAGQFVAGRQIGQAAHFARALGGVAHQTDQPLGDAVRARHARARHGEDDRAHGAGDLDIDDEKLLAVSRESSTACNSPRRSGAMASRKLRALAVSRCRGRMSVAPSQAMVPPATSQSKAAAPGALGRQAQAQLLFQPVQLGGLTMVLDCRVQHETTTSAADFSVRFCGPSMDRSP